MGTPQWGLNSEITRIGLLEFGGNQIWGKPVKNSTKQTYVVHIRHNLLMIIHFIGILDYKLKLL